MALWPAEDSANPDTEILNGLRPGMATVPDSLLLCISSPYARRGALWEAYKKHYGQDADAVLVWQADTRSMNPLVDPAVIEAAYAQDEAIASAEYGAQFRRDIESFISAEAVEAVVIPDRYELPYASSIEYFGFVDPSGGSSDSMTLAIAHLEGEEDDGKAILDCVRERRPPFSPESVAEEFSAVLKSYGIDLVVGDRYAGEWPREQFRKHGIEYRTAESDRSALYRELLPAINSRRVELLDNQRLVSQLCSLERRTSRSGKDSVDHPPQGHDDLINAAAGALISAFVEGDFDDGPVVEYWPSGGGGGWSYTYDYWKR